MRDAAGSANPTVICLPGLGANARLFGALVADGAVVPEWPDVAGDSIEGFADRVRDELIERGVWCGSVVVGFSFGGQVALTAARRAADAGLALPRGIVLVSAPRRSDAIVGRFRRQVAVSRLLPGGLIGWAAERVVAERFGRVCGLDETQNAELRRMAAELDVAEFKRQARIAAAWRFDAEDERTIVQAGVRIEHVHATRDPVIPAPAASIHGVDRVEGRAHLLTWTHAERVASAIERVVGA